MLVDDLDLLVDVQVDLLLVDLDVHLGRAVARGFLFGHDQVLREVQVLVIRLYHVAGWVLEPFTRLWICLIAFINAVIGLAPLEIRVDRSG